jgi:uncharacterized protein YndB with AHSA1/START domain
MAAWLDPKSLAQWMLPGDVAHTTVEIDPRVGGKFRIVMAHGRGDADHWGEYPIIDPPSLLSFTWISANTELQPSVVTIGSNSCARDASEPAAWLVSGRSRWKA